MVSSSKRTLNSLADGAERLVVRSGGAWRALLWSILHWFLIGKSILGNKDADEEAILALLKRVVVLP